MIDVKKISDVLISWILVALCACVLCLLEFHKNTHTHTYRPLKVIKVKEASEEDIAALRARMEDEITRLYEQYRPDWETRPLCLVRGETTADTQRG